MMNIKELVTNKLYSINIELKSDDELDFFIFEASEKLKNLLNVDELPSQTESLLSEMVAGFVIKNELVKSGNMNGEVNSIRQGDVSISYKDGASLLQTATKMTEPSEFQLAPFRRIVW